MAGHPSMGELVAAVRAFLAGLAEGSALAGRDAFHAKVAANALAIVERELAGEADAVEVAALTSYCHPRFREDDSEIEVATLRQTMCAAIRAGDLTVATPGLVDALIAATCARLAIDNPRYATLARLDPAIAADAAPRR